jgi:hypothetical protein
MREHPAREYDHIEMRCLERVAGTGYGSRLDRVEAEVTGGVRASATEPAKGWIPERPGTLICRVGVASVCVSLPDRRSPRWRLGGGQKFAA